MRRRKLGVCSDAPDVVTVAQHTMKLIDAATVKYFW